MPLFFLLFFSFDFDQLRQPFLRQQTDKVSITDTINLFNDDYEDDEYIWIHLYVLISSDACDQFEIFVIL